METCEADKMLIMGIVKRKNECLKLYQRSFLEMGEA